MTKKVERISRRPQAPKAEAKVVRQVGSTPSRLVVDVPEETHRALKIRAVEERTTMQKLVLRLLHEAGIPVPPGLL